MERTLWLAVGGVAGAARGRAPAPEVGCSDPSRGRRQPSAGRRACRVLAVLGLLVVALEPARPRAEVILPPGFTVRVHVTGDGFDAARGLPGVPSASTLAVDGAGFLYLARTGRRYGGGEGDELVPIWRIPPGGARLTPATEAQYFYGPPLLNPQVAAVREGEVLVTTFDRDRRVGVLYRLVDGEAHRLAGGTPPPGVPVLLQQPEGVAVDPAGRIYIADRAQNRVSRLDARGGLLEAAWLSLVRPRLATADDTGGIWIAADGEVEAPWQRGRGAIWRASPDGAAQAVLDGLVAAGLAALPGGRLLVADRHAAEIFLLTPAGRRMPFARFTDGDAPRAIAVAPDAPATRRAGIAGDLFVVRLVRGAWALNDVLRISGPFATLGPAAVPAP
ncbi:MAG TPA: hypothetical protein VNK50_04465 [Calidithermus sp.]|nr:hypothetical protein [Calidithermus sp.]